MTVKNINTALLEAQQNIGAAVKGAENPFFKSSYADLATVMEVVKKPLNDAGISISHETEVGINDITGSPFNILSTVLRYTDGTSLRSSMLVPEVKDIQKLGAAITYLKRYSLQAMLFVPTLDDDGNSVVGNKPKAVPRKKTLTDVPF